MAYDPTHEYEHNYHSSIRARKLANAAHANRVNQQRATLVLWSINADVYK